MRCLPTNSPLIGHALQDIENPWRVRVVAVKSGHTPRIGPGSLARDVGIEAGTTLGILASPVALSRFADEFGLTSRTQIRTFVDELSPLTSGIAELVIPPNSTLVGSSARDVWMRKTYGIALVALHRGGETFREGDGVRRMAFQPGDTLVVHTTWDALARLKNNRNFVVVTTEYPQEELRPQKVPHAAFFFALALALVLFTDLRLSVALLTGALGMVLSGVMRIEEAYEAISWKTVSLLASLIPLGIAVETTETARWVDQVISVVGTMPIWVIQTTIAVLQHSSRWSAPSARPCCWYRWPLTSYRRWRRSGVVNGCTGHVQFVPDSNAPVNALIMGPGGYRVPDFMRRHHDDHSGGPDRDDEPDLLAPAAVVPSAGLMMWIAARLQRRRFRLNNCRRSVAHPSANPARYCA